MGKSVDRNYVRGILQRAFMKTKKSFGDNTGILWAQQYMICAKFEYVIGRKEVVIIGTKEVKACGNPAGPSDVRGIYQFVFFGIVRRFSRCLYI